jgi:hypothetical protein
LAATLVVATLAWQLNHYFAMPVYDDIFDRLRLYRTLPNLSALMQYFISAHNEHRIFTTRLFICIDEFIFSGREYTQVIMTNGLQLSSAYMAYRLVCLTGLENAGCGLTCDGIFTLARHATHWMQLASVSRCE